MLEYCWFDPSEQIQIQWNSYQNITIFIKENAFKDVVCRVSSILSRSQCVNTTNKIDQCQTTKQNKTGTVYIFIGIEHYSDLTMGEIASKITNFTIIYSTVYSDADQRKHQIFASLAFVPVNSPHKRPVTRKIFPFDDVIMIMIIIVSYLP